MHRVFNKKHGNAPSGAVYVGRPSKWGNPFTHLEGQSLARFRVRTREEAVARYREWILQQAHLMAALGELRGRDLVCWCAPQACHADVLLELANPGSG